MDERVSYELSIGNTDVTVKCDTADVRILLKSKKTGEIIFKKMSVEKFVKRIFMNELRSRKAKNIMELFL